MGLYDEVSVEYRLPGVPPEGCVFQTKDFLYPCLDRYRIDTEGQLWIEAYTLEDQSDPSAEGLARIIGMITKVNQHWVRSEWSGVLELDYSTLTSYDPDGNWVTTTDGDLPQTWTYTLTMVSGRLQSVSATHTVMADVQVKPKRRR